MKNKSLVPDETTTRNIHNATACPCPCCGQLTTEKLDERLKSLPLHWLQHHAENKNRKWKGRDWKTDPRPGDEIAILDSAYAERVKAGEDKMPILLKVVKVAGGRVFYSTYGVDGPMQSCSTDEWGRFDAELWACSRHTPAAQFADASS